VSQPPFRGNVILDTNVLFSAVARADGPPARALLAIGIHGMLISAELVSEYRRVLLLPRSLRYLGISRGQVLELLAYIESGAALVEPEPGPEAPDPDDQHVWDLLATVGQAVLVTGDRNLLDSRDFPGRVMSPRDFVTRFLE
jgi:putative PIN family toxin of toxin-antitoxin system